MNINSRASRRAGIAAIAVGALLGAAAPIAVSATTNTSTVQPDAQQNRGTIRLDNQGSATVNGAVSRGDWHHWAVRVQRGQEIQIAINAQLGNATFELYDPNGNQLANDVFGSSSTASVSGLYAIDVGSTGGLANYALSVAITGTPIPLPPPAPPAPPSGQTNKGQIQFASGASSGSVSGTVARGGWHHWGARARAGQQIQVSLSGNATFELYTPSGDQMANDVTSFSGTLPADGNYAIDVGSAGGTANYMLTVSITGSRSAPAPTPTPAPPADPGNLPGHSQGRIQFAPGASSGSVDGSVERGNWHEWSFRANGGQSATLTVSSGGNATFSLYAPNGDVLAAHTTSFSGTLPATGFYMIEVGSTSGWANYQLDLTIT